MGFFIADCAIRLWADVKHQAAVFANHVDEVADQLIGCFKMVPFCVAPGVFGNGSVVLPGAGIDRRKLPTLNIQYGAFIHHAIPLIKNANLHAPLAGTVVVICQEFFI